MCSVFTEEEQVVEDSLRARSHAELLELASEMNVQDPAPTRDGLVTQLVPLLVFDERVASLKALLDDGADHLVAVVSEGDSEVFGWFLDIDRDKHLLYLAPLNGNDEPLRIPIIDTSQVRVCEGPRAQADALLGLSLEPESEAEWMFEVLTALQQAWERSPEMRLGQLLLNVTRNSEGATDKHRLWTMDSKEIVRSLLSWAEGDE